MPYENNVNKRSSKMKYLSRFEEKYIKILKKLFQNND